MYRLIENQTKCLLHLCHLATLFIYIRKDPFGANGEFFHMMYSIISTTFQHILHKYRMIYYFYKSTDGVTKKYRVEMKNLDAKFVGTGDLFASCLLASLHKDKDLKVL